MWKFLGVAVLFSFGLCGDRDYSSDYWSNYGRVGEEHHADDKHGGVWIGYDDDNSETTLTLPLKVNEEKVTNEDYFIRPCALTDWHCVRQFFAHNSHCRSANGPVPDPLYIARITNNIPNANLTFTYTDVKVVGLRSAKITEFYFNKKTDNLVFAMEVQSLNQTIKKAYFNYRRTAKESIVLADHATVDYSEGIIFTAVIPKDKSGLRLDLAEMHGYINNDIPPFTLGPKAYTSKDPDVVEAYAALVGSSSLQTTVRETFFFQPRLFITVYIQQTICDFGLKIRSY